MRLFFCMALLVHVFTWFPTTCRLLPPHHNYSSPGNKVGDESVEGPYSSIQDSKQSYGGMEQVGSRPPNCEHKCDGCNPCIAIQVPTITSHLGIQFANYEPESWKCKCGPTVFSP
ncbi:hypothetical protein vseg_004103 [Gypsophila vaccaria]